jgi:hypothetical protein
VCGQITSAGISHAASHVWPRQVSRRAAAASRMRCPARQHDQVAQAAQPYGVSHLAADILLARMRLALLGSILGSSRGSSAGCLPPLPLRCVLLWMSSGRICGGRSLSTAMSPAGRGQGRGRQQVGRWGLLIILEHAGCRPQPMQAPHSDTPVHAAAAQLIEGTSTRVQARAGLSTALCAGSSRQQQRSTHSRPSS